MPTLVTPQFVTSTEGVYLTLSDSSKLIDAMSSWWAAAFGHGHPKLKEAAHQQIETMSHVMFGGLTHSPAIELARKLISITDNGLEKVFFRLGICSRRSVDEDGLSISARHRSSRAPSPAHMAGRLSRRYFCHHERVRPKRRYALDVGR